MRGRVSGGVAGAVSAGKGGGTVEADAAVGEAGATGKSRQALMLTYADVC